MKKEKIIDFCNSLGLDTIGFIKCRRFEELEAFFYERKKKDLKMNLKKKIYQRE